MGNCTIHRFISLFPSYRNHLHWLLNVLAVRLRRLNPRRLDFILEWKLENTCLDTGFFTKSLHDHSFVSRYSTPTEICASDAR